MRNCKSSDFLKVIGHLSLLHLQVFLWIFFSSDFGTNINAIFIAYIVKTSMKLGFSSVRVSIIN